MRRWLLVAAASAFAAGCSDQGPVSGELSVRAATQFVGLRAVQFVVKGPVSGVTRPTGSGYQVFSDAPSGADSTHVVVVSAPGTGLVAGEIARIAVSDTRQVRSYAAHVAALSGASYNLLDTSLVVLTVVRP
ncbi:MAG TPA: hypothetical protein VEH62_09235 [Gemmatimonadales bacterium]|nr:hypothetical protein [Gemmatimonadales bacterium]